MTKHYFFKTKLAFITKVLIINPTLVFDWPIWYNLFFASLFKRLTFEERRIKFTTKLNPVQQQTYNNICLYSKAFIFCLLLVVVAYATTQHNINLQCACY